MKKIISLFFAVIIFALCMLPAVTAAETDPAYIYFEIPTDGSTAWNNFSMVYCHMWSKSGGDIYGWQDKAERCEDMGNGYWRYGLRDISFDEDGEYSLIFSNENGMQTYNLNITSSCMGDIVYCSGDVCPNPVDGEKSCAVARWRNNGDKVHPAIETDSTGSILNPDEADADDIETKWGTEKGSSVELADLSASYVSAETEAEKESAAISADEVADKEDGINLTAATTWIIIVSVLLAGAILTLTVIFAKRNKKND